MRFFNFIGLMKKIVCNLKCNKEGLIFALFIRGRFVILKHFEERKKRNKALMIVCVL